MIQVSVILLLIFLLVSNQLACDARQNQNDKCARKIIKKKENRILFSCLKKPLLSEGNMTVAFHQHAFLDNQLVRGRISLTSILSLLTVDEVEQFLITRLCTILRKSPNTQLVSVMNFIAFKLTNCLNT